MIARLRRSHARIKSDLVTGDVSNGQNSGSEHKLRKLKTNGNQHVCEADVHIEAAKEVEVAKEIDPLSIPPVYANFINKKLPKELLIRCFSFLDIVSLSRCSQVCKYWNELALDGSNWQYIDLFEFQTNVNGNVLDNISKHCNEFLKAIRLEIAVG